MQSKSKGDLNLGDVRRSRLFASARGRRARTLALRPSLEAVERRTLMVSSPLVIAALGDSLTDEYQFYGAATPTPPSLPLPFPFTPGFATTTVPPEIYLTGRNAARNWVMNIGANRGSQLSFGDYTTFTRNQTRNQGYQENWAETGTTAVGPDVSGTATTFVDEYEGIPPEFSQGFNPTPGLITQTSPSDISIKKIDVVTILIGANDYNAALSAYNLQSDKLDTHVFDTANTNIETAISSAIASIGAAATAAGNPNLKFVVITTPNITVAPLIQDEAGGDLALLKLVIGEKIGLLDFNLGQTYGGNPKVGLINSTAIIDQFIANPVIDGVTVNMEGAGQDYTDGFIGDGFHPGTIVQGLIAQAVVASVNTLEGSQVVTPISDADIVNYARNSQPTIALTSSATTTTVGQGITFKATVTPALVGATPATGRVTFEQILPAIGGEPSQPGLILGNVPLSAAGTATLTVDHLPPGQYAIAAIYNGDLKNDARLSTTVDQTVTTTPATTSTTLYSATNPSLPGKSITFTSTVRAPGSGLPSPAGLVTFRDQTANKVLGSASLNAQGVATLQASLVSLGSHKIVATYGGASMLAASTSAALVETVNAPPPVNRSTTTQVVASYFIDKGRAWVNLEVVVTPVDPKAGNPNGTVTLNFGLPQVRKLNLNQGTALLTVPYSVVAHRFASAYFPGNALLQASGSSFVYINRRPVPVSTNAPGHSSRLMTHGMPAS